MCTTKYTPADNTTEAHPAVCLCPTKGGGSTEGIRRGLLWLERRAEAHANQRRTRHLAKACGLLLKSAKTKQETQRTSPSRNASPGRNRNGTSRTIHLPTWWDLALPGFAATARVGVEERRGVRLRTTAPSNCRTGVDERTVGAPGIPGDPA